MDAMRQEIAHLRGLLAAQPSSARADVGTHDLLRRDEVQDDRGGGAAAAAVEQPALRRLDLVAQRCAAVRASFRDQHTLKWTKN